METHTADGRPVPEDDAAAVCAACFTGPFDWMADRVVCGPAEGLFPARDVADPDRLGPVLARYAGLYPGAPRRAVVSLWSQYYAGHLVPPVMALALAGRLPDLDPAGTGVVLDAAGCPIRLCLADRPPAAVPDLDAGALADRLVGHLEPVVRALAAAGGLSEKVIWSNAAVMGEWLLDVGGHVDPVRAARARVLFSERTRPCGARNPLHEPTRPAPCPADPAARRRRVCCQRLDIPGIKACAICPDRRAASRTLPGGS